MSTNPVTNGGIDPKPMVITDWKKHALDFEPGSISAQDMVEFGKYVKDLIVANPDNFRIFGPDETKSNRLTSVFDVTNRQWLGAKKKTMMNGSHQLVVSLMVNYLSINVKDSWKVMSNRASRILC